MRRPIFKTLTLCSLLFLALTARAAITTTNEDWNVALLDQILASVPPGATLAQIGDMQVSVDYLQAWRNYLAGGQQSRLAFAHGFTPWPGGNVYYQFDASVSSTNQKVFLDCCAEWATFVNLHFIARTSQANYIVVTNNPTLSGGLSVVGMGGGPQLLQIGPAAWNHGTVVHEIGHALGLVHEFERSDRDNYVTINTNNIGTNEIFNFVLLTGTTNETPYDFLSVMHYSRTAFSTNGLDTIDPKPAYMQYINVMGHPDPVLSAGDRAGVIAIYGAGPGATNIVTNTLDSGPGSLRAALYYGYDHPGATIRFNIPVTDPGYSNSVFNILPSDQLTSIWGNTLVDGTTEPGYAGAPKILLNGLSCQTASEAYASGLQFRGTNSTARGFIINKFPEFGVLMDGTNTVGNTISGCYLGTDPTGTLAVTNGICPVQISDSAVSNLISSNVISGSDIEGVAVRDPGTSFNSVQGNYIGLNAAGTGALPNGYAGVEIFNGASSNTIGGFTSGAGNVISGNTQDGVLIYGPAAADNLVAGNYIGLNAAGTAAISNRWSGVDIYDNAFNITVAGNVISGNTNFGVLVAGNSNSIWGNIIGLNAAGTGVVSNFYSGVSLQSGSSYNIVGGSTTASRNVISGNVGDGVQIIGPGSSSNLVAGNYLGVNLAGSTAFGNGGAGVDLFNIAAGNVIASNLISGNLNAGINLVGNFNSIWGNSVGLNAAGSAAIPNAGTGVAVFSGALSNSVGGFSPGMRNIISGNAGDGIYVGYPGTTGNLVAGNYVGVNPGGSLILGNGGGGVVIDQSAATVVASNVVSGNSGDGVDITGNNNAVWGNFVGLNAPGTAAIGNAAVGMVIYPGSQANTIGGVTSAARNVISGNKRQGILLYTAPVTGNLIEGNYIGLNAAGTAAISNYWSGIEIYGGPVGNTVGGYGGARNFISGNGNYGIAIDTGSSNNLVQGNTLGLDGNNAAAMPNNYDNIICFSSAPGNIIGGTTPGSANIIAYSKMYYGVRINDTGCTNDLIRGNSIFSNSLGGISLNLAGNHTIAAPTLSTVLVGTNTVITGSYNGANGTIYQFDFYSDTAVSGAQAMTYLGARSFTGTGLTANFTNSLGARVPAGRAVTVTATDPAGNTSALSSGSLVRMTSAPNDGIPDAWRALFFGAASTNSPTSTNSTTYAGGDPDHDGMSNLQEFLSGTNPTNAASVFNLTAQNPVTTTNAVALNSANGIVYRILSRDDLLSGSWNILADQVIGTGTNIYFPDPAASSLTKRFYRAQVLW
ncbi:MAG TPA: M12 family metallopeptidase [Candidatus Sulfotelmatobacter sp.]|nr:M12 family metallopeptidase [Candidatus Sulfotelmatobacter sp.]